MYVLKDKDGKLCGLFNELYVIKRSLEISYSAFKEVKVTVTHELAEVEVDGNTITFPIEIGSIIEEPEHL